MTATHILMHASATSASNASEQSAQTTFSIGHFGKEQIRIIDGPSNHCVAHAKLSGMRELVQGSTSPSPHLSVSPVNSEEDDGGGGPRVRKKRKKKDKKDTREDRDCDIRPRKKKVQKEGKGLLLKKSKTLKEIKETKKAEGKAVKDPKKVKKVQEVKSKTQGKDVTSPPRQRGRKPK